MNIFRRTLGSRNEIILIRTLSKKESNLKTVYLTKELDYFKVQLNFQ